jgi:hypothetical protein
MKVTRAENVIPQPQAERAQRSGFSLVRFLRFCGRSNLQPTTTRSVCSFGGRLRQLFRRAANLLCPCLRRPQPVISPAPNTCDDDYQRHQGHIAILLMLKSACQTHEQWQRLLAHAIAVHQQAQFTDRDEYLAQDTRKLNYALLMLKTDQTKQEICQLLLRDGVRLPADNYVCLRFIDSQLEKFCAAQQAQQAQFAALTGYQPGDDAQLDAVLSMQTEKQRVLRLSLKQAWLAAQQQWKAISPLLVDVLLPATHQYVARHPDQQAAVEQQLQQSFLSEYVQKKPGAVFKLLTRRTLGLGFLDYSQFRLACQACLEHEKSQVSPGALGQILLSCQSALLARLNREVPAAGEASAMAQQALTLLQDYPLDLGELYFRAAARKRLLDMLAQGIAYKQKKIGKSQWWRLFVQDFLGSDGRRLALLRRAQQQLQGIALSRADFSTVFDASWRQICQEYYDLGLLGCGDILQTLQQASVSGQITAWRRAGMASGQLQH